VPVMDYQVDLNWKGMNDIVSKFELGAHLRVRGRFTTLQ